MSMIRFIYNMNKAEIDYENIEKSLLNHINKILGNNYEEFLQEIEFTDEKLIIEGQVNFGQYNQNMKRIIIRKDSFERLLDTFIHEVFHVKFAMDYSHFYYTLNENGIRGYNFINEIFAIVNATMYLFKLDLNKYEPIFLDQMRKYKEFDEDYGKALKSINEYEDIMIGLDFNDEEIDEGLKSLYNVLCKEANLSEYKISQKYANLYICNEYYKINYPLGKQDYIYQALEQLKTCKVTPEICNEIFNKQKVFN